MELILIALLGDPKFQVREKAHTALEQRMDMDLYLATRSCNISDAEASWRLNKIVKNFERKVFWPNLKEYPVYPFIDSLPYSYPNRRDIIDRYLNKVTGGHPSHSCWDNDYPEYRHATELWVNDRVNKAMKSVTADTALQKDIDDMILGDDRQYKDIRRKNPRRPK